MIDWLTFECLCDHEEIINGGSVVKLSPDGSLDWATDTWLSVVGSYDNKIQIRSMSNNKLEISGNPAKFLQGHNLFGTNNLTLLLTRFFEKLVTFSDLKLTPTAEQLKLIENGRIHIRRMDINETWHLENQAQVLSFIRAMEQKAHLKRRGRGEFKGDTLYFGKNSRYWSLKAYSKGQEIQVKKHQLPPELQTKEMLDYADKALRIELVLRSMTLRNISPIFDFTREDNIRLLLQTHLEFLDMNDNFALDDSVIDTLSTTHQNTYQFWLRGIDLRDKYSKSKFYAHRAELLKHNIDIAVVNDKAVPNNVIPMIRVLEAKPVGIPDWAYEKELVVA